MIIDMTNATLRPRPRRERLVGLALLALLVGGIAGGVMAEPVLAATYRIRAATLRSCPGGKAADPINVAFVGTHATAGNSRDLIADRGLKWGGNDYPFGGSRQWIINDDGGCHHDDHQNTRGIRNKHHTREFELADSQHGDRVTLQDAHRDVKRLKCNFHDTVPPRMGYKEHTLSGYDHAQREFFDAFQSRYVGTQRSPRHMTYTQCNPANGKHIQVGWSGVVNFYAVNADYP